MAANRIMYYSLNEKCGDFMYFCLLGSEEKIIFQYLRSCRDDTHYCIFYSVAKPMEKSFIFSRPAM